jgi:hypothetical protein
MVDDEKDEQPTIEQLWDARYFLVTYTPESGLAPEHVIAHMMNGDEGFISFQQVKRHAIRGDISSTILSVRASDIRRIEEVTRESITAGAKATTVN